MLQKKYKKKYIERRFSLLNTYLLTYLCSSRTVLINHLYYFQISLLCLVPSGVKKVCWQQLCTVYSVQCIMYSVQCTVYNVQCTVYSVNFKVYSVQCRTLSVQCKLYSVRYTKFGVQGTVYIVQARQDTPLNCTVKHSRQYMESYEPDLIKSSPTLTYP